MVPEEQESKFTVILTYVSLSFEVHAFKNFSQFEPKFIVKS